MQLLEGIACQKKNHISSGPWPIGSSGRRERRFSRDPFPVFSAGSHHVQFWQMQGCPLFYVVCPAFPLPTTTSHSIQGASQLARIISELRETLIKTYIVGKKPVRQTWDQKNKVRKRRVVGRIFGMKYSWKGHKSETDTRTELKQQQKKWASSAGLCLRHKL